MPQCFCWAPCAGAVLLSDGYEAYASCAKKSGVTHAQCWVHARRGFFEAQAAEPQAAGEALRQIGALYEIEDDIGRTKLSGENKRLHRLMHSKPRVEQFFDWVDRQFEQQGLLQGLGLCARAPGGTAGVSRRCRRADGYEPSGACAARDPDGQKELVVLLDRGRRQTRGHRAEPIDRAHSLLAHSLRVLSWLRTGEKERCRKPAQAAFPNCEETKWDASHRSQAIVAFHQRTLPMAERGRST